MQNQLDSSIVIPTYWARHAPKATDVVYDHPTALNENGTLGRLLESVKILKNKDFGIIIISVPTAEDIVEEVKAKVDKIIKPFKDLYPIHHFSYLDMVRLQKTIKGLGKLEYLPYISLQGYSDVRNVCLILPHLLGATVAILIDDDEVFEDPEFINKAQEFVGENNLYGVAGYYIQPWGDYKFKGKSEWWKILWKNTKAMNKAFERIDSPERLKETPFAFGGCMVIRKELFTKITFDPYITRGEDIDFLYSAKVQGFKFLLDNQLSIRHLPLKEKNPLWMKLREDIKRFVYMRIKLREQNYPIENTMPYPGYFLKSDLWLRIVITNLLLAKTAFLKLKISEMFKFLENITIMFQSFKKAYPEFQKFLELAKQWPLFMNWIVQNRDTLLKN